MAANGAVSLSNYVRLVRTNRNFRLLWAAQVISEIGDWFYIVAIYSMLLEFTGSAESITLAFVLQVLPQTLIAPAAGMINDRLSRRRVMMFADWSRAIVVLCMLLVRGPGMIWFLYLLLFLETVAWGLFEPGRNASIPNIVPKQDILLANGLSSATWSFNLAVGSAIGGLAAVWLGRDAVFLINSLSFVASGLLIRSMRFDEPHATDRHSARWKHLLDFSPVLDGVRYTFRNRRSSVILFAKCGLGLTMGASWVLLPIFGERLFPVRLDGMNRTAAGMLGMSLLMGCRGAGALMAPFLASPLAGMSEHRLRWGILFGYIGSGLGYLWLSLSPNLWHAGAAIVVAHLAGSSVWIFSTTLLQMYTSDQFLGRVFSSEFAFAMLSSAMLNYTCGWLIDSHWEVRAVTMLVAGLVLIPIFAWTVFALVLPGDHPDPGEALIQ